jgi:hypothetical protein
LTLPRDFHRIALLSESKRLKPKRNASRPTGEAGNGFTFHL